MHILNWEFLNTTTNSATDQVSHVVVNIECKLEPLSDVWNNVFEINLLKKMRERALDWCRLQSFRNIIGHFYWEQENFINLCKNCLWYLFQKLIKNLFSFCTKIMKLFTKLFMGQSKRWWFGLKKPHLSMKTTYWVTWTGKLICVVFKLQTVLCCWLTLFVRSRL